MKRTIAFFLSLLLQCCTAGFVANASAANADTDISGYANTLYIPGGTVDIEDGTVVVPIKMKAAVNVTGFQFDLKLPDGIDASQVSLEMSLARKENHLVFASAEQTNGDIRAICYINEMDAHFASEEAKVVNLVISKAKPGTYTFTLSALELAEVGTPHRVSKNIVSTVEFKSQSAVLLGDVNNDGLVNSNDIVALCNIILGRDKTGLNLIAADVNQDNSINSNDMVALINLILHR